MVSVNAGGVGSWSVSARHRRASATVGAAVSAVLAVMVLCLSVFGSHVVPRALADDDKQDSLGVVGWTMCNLVPGGDIIYNMVSTDVVPYELLSKSAAASLDRVDAGINGMISYAGRDFAETNSRIVGYNVSVTPRAADAEELSFNGGERVTPYDRFGVSGLKLSAYYGEWKYYKFDACKGEDPQDLKGSVFYPGRLEPKTTYSALSASQDVRSQAYDSSTMYKWGVGFANGAANFVFLLTKIVVGATIALIGLAFADPTASFGLSSVVDGDSGLFVRLMEGVFTPLSVLAVILSLMVALWAFVKSGSVRAALKLAIRPFVILFVAGMLSAIPALVVSAPARAASLVHGVVLSGVSQQFESQSTMCGKTGGNVGGVNDGESVEAALTRAGLDAQSAVGCQLWEQLLLRPWSIAQYGVDYNHLWANGYAPENMVDAEGEQVSELGNVNDSMVGDAPVPLGGGEFMHNWAVFQVSTQTRAHALVGKDGVDPLPNLAVQTDWYRVVDALSNYEEEQRSETPSGATAAVTYTAPKDNQPSPYWQMWTGRDMLARLGAVFSSLVVASVALVAPMLLALSSVVFGLGLVMVMCLLPLFLLFGLWSGPGWRALGQWWRLLVKVFAFKLGAGLLLIVDLLFTGALLNMLGELGWWTTMMFLIVVGLVVWLGRKRLYNVLLSALSAGGATESAALSGLAGSMRRVGSRTLGVGRNVGNVAAAGVAGAATARSYGRSAKSGFWDGLREQGKLFVYTRPGLETAVGVYEDRAAGREGLAKFAGRSCASCGGPLVDSEAEDGVGVFNGGRLASGAYICRVCYESSLFDDSDPAMAVTIRFNQAADEKYEQARKDEAQNLVYEEDKRLMGDGASVMHSDAVADVIRTVEAVGDHRKAMSDAEMRNALTLLMTAFECEERAHMERAVHWGGDFKRAGVFRLPPEVEAHVDRAALDALASRGEYEAARELVADAVISYYHDRTGRDYRAGLPVTGSSSSEMLLEDAALSRGEKHGLSGFARDNQYVVALRDSDGVVNGSNRDGGNSKRDVGKSSQKGALGAATDVENESEADK